ncbi:hypothetical protein [Actinomadura fibrosa]|uniref:Uncharacterized protein n=1 Tax=Actinomadura fibrosa TaxID=111802 RepID=A0ABW2XBZ8_9ACTN|nr:hypothetical protein [Actinomadura fibrosa]
MTDGQAPAEAAARRRAALLAELRRLCRGWGVQAPDLPGRIGPQLGRYLDGGADPRRALISLLSGAAAGLPGDLPDAARAALGLEPRFRFLKDRQSWLAARLDRDMRTARRRIDEALALMAERITAESIAAESIAAPSIAVGGHGPGPAAPAVPAADADGWYTETLQTLVRMDRDPPAIQEERRIAVTAPLLEVITVPVSLPPAPAAPSGRPRDLFAEVLYGGIDAGTERPSQSHFRFLVRPPRPLRAGERHSFALGYSLPPGQPLAPHYALTPLRRYDGFRLRVRFAADRPPEGLWLVAGVPPRTLDDAPDGLPAVELDAAQEAEASFTDMSIGLAYGFRWREAR